MLMCLALIVMLPPLVFELVSSLCTASRRVSTADVSASLGEGVAPVGGASESSGGDDGGGGEDLHEGVAFLKKTR